MDVWSHEERLNLNQTCKRISKSSTSNNEDHREKATTVEPLSNDHPSYTTIFCVTDTVVCLYDLTNDHPSDATNDRVRRDFLPRERPPRLQCISKNRAWRFNIRSQWWIITMLCLDTFQVIQLI